MITSGHYCRGRILNLQSQGFPDKGLGSGSGVDCARISGDAVAFRASHPPQAVGASAAICSGILWGGR
jgi:hypothetical protein